MNKKQQKTYTFLIFIINIYRKEMNFYVFFTKINKKLKNLKLNN